MGKDDRLHSGHRLDESAMRRRRNRWHVYEYMKQSYMFTGEVPNRTDLKIEFAEEADTEEIEAGHREFIETVKRFFPKRYFRRRLERMR